MEYKLCTIFTISSISPNTSQHAYIYDTLHIYIHTKAMVGTLEGVNVQIFHYKKAIFLKDIKAIRAGCRLSEGLTKGLNSIKQNILHHTYQIISKLCDCTGRSGTL